MDRRRKLRTREKEEKGIKYHTTKQTKTEERKEKRLLKNANTQNSNAAPGNAGHLDAFRAALAGFFIMLIFVFVGHGSGMA